MAGDIGDVSDPAPIVLKHIDQVATYLATRQRASVKLEPIALHIDGGDEHAVDLGGQRHLRVDAEIASALGNRDVSEACVAHCNHKYDGYTIESQPALQTSDLGRAHPGWFGQARKQVAKRVHHHELRDKDWQARLPPILSKNGSRNRIRTHRIDQLIKWPTRTGAQARGPSR